LDQIWYAKFLFWIPVTKIRFVEETTLALYFVVTFFGHLLDR